MASPPSPDVIEHHAKEEGAFSAQDRSDTLDDLIANAKAATEKEQKMSLWQGIKLYPKAVAWSVLISTCIVMEGYDICLVGNFYGFPQWNRKYGEQLPDGTYQVPARVSAAVSAHEIRGTVG